jgi:hypothetical protein
MTVRDAFKDEMAMLAQPKTEEEVEGKWLEEILTDVDISVKSDDTHELIHAVLQRIVRETLVRIYGRLLWIDTDLKVMEDPTPHYLLGVMAIERDAGICVTWDKHAKTPYLYRDLYSVEDLIRLIEGVDLKVCEFFGAEARGNYSEALTSANQTLDELARTYNVFEARDASVIDVSEFLCEHPRLCPALKEIAKRTRETFPNATTTIGVYHDPETDDEYLRVQVQPSQPDDTLNEKLDQILNAVSGKFKGVSGWIRLAVEP